MFHFTLTTIQHFLYYCEVAEQQLKVKVTYKRLLFFLIVMRIGKIFFDFTVPASGQEAIKRFSSASVWSFKKRSPDLCIEIAYP